MTTSDLPGRKGEGELGSAGDLSSSLAGRIQALANEFFHGIPGTVASPGRLPGTSALPTPSPSLVSGLPAVPPNFGPSALAVGAGGASPAVVLPPVPGILQSPPIPNAPAPKDSDLRTLPAMFSESLGSSPLALARAADAPTTQPYFLELAGLPGADRSAAALPIGSARPELPASVIEGYEFRPELSPNEFATGSFFDPHAVKRDFPIL
ncbi:MAG TPA: hypothetical protein VK524_02575, partial [Polyangiaceae bacterium]|nr:hypothetical protein [Polyangiaceae bacterium]